MIVSLRVGHPRSNKPRNIVGGGGGLLGGVGGMGGMSIGGPAPGIPGASKGPLYPGAEAGRWSGDHMPS